MSQKILVFAEQRDGQFRKPALEICSAAAELAEKHEMSLSAVLIGEGVANIAPQLAEYGISEIWAGEGEGLNRYNLENYAAILQQAVKQLSPNTIIMAASAMGKELAPYLAAKLGVGLAADLTELIVTDGKISAKRPVFAGKAFVNVAFQTEMQLFSIRPNTFPAEKRPTSANVQKLSFVLPAEGARSQVKETLRQESKRPELTEAGIIVSGGRGMGGPEKYVVIEELADLLGAAVGASRAAVDAGWRPHSDQVGQTGKTVSPNLYIACGISGAIQHLAGMSSSKFIVAINKDPEAPIFKVADYGVVGDLFTVVPAMVTELKK
ncbi:MAG TPA: electron transfer flavoprotein subunit alpha/FixB family protein [Candidatus Marinimicrobia bacterium]|nr:electron transfer flavoprotein subunit alpha/FixB family protein [Candidatus Neomarinimicrobiota bacterium]